MKNLPTTKYEIIETNGFFVTKLDHGYRVESASRRIDLRTYAAINMGRLVSATMRAMAGSKTDQKSVRPYISKHKTINT